MNSLPNPAAWSVLRLVPAALASCALLASLVRAAAPEPPVQPPKTHTLFMGANLSIFSKDGTVLPVRDIQGNAFVAFDAKRRVVASAEDEQFKLKIDDALKLTAVRATVDKLVLERTYTPERDPMTRMKEAARVGTYMAANMDAADAAVRSAEVGAGLATGQVDWMKANNAHPEALGAALAVQAHTAGVLAAAQSDSSRAQTVGNMEALSTGSNSSILTSDLAAEQYDALNITFELSSPRSLEKPYMVFFVRYLAEKNRPDSASVWVYGERLSAIDEHPRKILIRRGGFPPGYHIDSYHVHLYDAGTEIATNVSRKQVALSTDEAFEYSVMDYIGSNRGQTKAPAISRTFWPGDLSSRLIAEKLSRNLHAKVRKDGRVAGLFEDTGCTQPVSDADIAALIPMLRFLPALEKGKAVEGVAQFTLAPISY